MARPKGRPDPRKQAELLASLHRDQSQREKSYRSQALKLFPHVCARCSRELSGKRLRELTVHHKDHDHRNNPADGSNWELLCVYCHDHEHEKYLMKGYGGGPDDASTDKPLGNPFDDLDKLLG